mgnify:CR=1 FL=1
MNKEQKQLNNKRTAYEEGIDHKGYTNHYKVDCEDTLEWYDLFVDYIEESNINLYNDACEYADNQKKDI